MLCRIVQEIQVFEQKNPDHLNIYLIIVHDAYN